MDGFIGPGDPALLQTQCVSVLNCRIFADGPSGSPRYPPTDRGCRSGAEFAKVIATLARRYRLARTVHLVADNLYIHCRKSLTDHFGLEQGALLWNRFTVYYPPKHGSSLNQAELEIGLFARQCLGQRRLPDLPR